MSTTKEAIDALLAGKVNFSESGWGGLEHAEALTEEQQKQQQLRSYQAAKEIAAPFMNPAGQLCLQRLREQTTLAPTWMDGIGLLNGIATGFAREGQNSMIRFIENAIKTAQAGPPKPAAVPKKEGKK